MDCGDHVVVINAEKVALTGGKEQKKLAHRHSGYPGGITSTRYGDLMADKPVFVVEKAVRGMLPKNRLGRTMIKKLHVVAGPEHPHAAQRPTPYTLGEPPVWAGLPEPKVRSAAGRCERDGARADGAGREEAKARDEAGSEDGHRREACRQEGQREEDHGQEGDREEDHGHDDHGQEVHRQEGGEGRHAHRDRHRVRSFCGRYPCEDQHRTP